MGIINVTPDSFSDGGLNLDAKSAIDTGLRMTDEGADLIDVGGESTRPGADDVSVEEELRRVIPVVEGLVRRGITVSIDTMKPRVAREAIEAGVEIVNDVTALADPAMADLVRELRCTVCLMHMKGTPRTMQQNPTYEDVVGEVRSALVKQAEGIPKNKVWIDPGIGFGKNIKHNLLLLQGLEAFVSTGYPVMVGVSRKSFIGRVLDGEHPLPVEQRLEGTLAAQAVAQIKGARIIRAHDVREARRGIEMVAAIMHADSR
jgi:dihydropteroate synthase